MHDTRCTAKKYGQQNTMEADLAELEGPVLGVLGSGGEEEGASTPRADFPETPMQRSGAQQCSKTLQWRMKCMGGNGVDDIYTLWHHLNRV